MDPSRVALFLLLSPLLVGCGMHRLGGTDEDGGSETGGSLGDEGEGTGDSGQEPSGDTGGEEPPELPPLPPTGDPGVPGSSLPEFGPDCGFVEEVLDFGALTVPYVFGYLRLGPCGHLYREHTSEIMDPDGTSWAIPEGSIEWALTGELAKVRVGADLGLVDLVAHSTRLIDNTNEDEWFVPSFVDGVRSRLVTCDANGLWVHDANESWALDELPCTHLSPSQGAPVVVYRAQTQLRVANTDTGFRASLDIPPEPSGDCYDSASPGYDGDIVQHTWTCWEEHWDEYDQMSLVDVINNVSLISAKTGDEIAFDSFPYEIRQLLMRGGAWQLKPSGHPEHQWKTFQAGELVLLPEGVSGPFVSGGFVYFLDRHLDTGVTVLQSADKGFSYAPIFVSPIVRAISANQEGTAVVLRIDDASPSNSDLWVEAEGWAWTQSLFGYLRDIFADGTIVILEDAGTLSTQLRSPDGQLVRSWPGQRQVERLGERMLMSWGHVSYQPPEFVPGGLSLVDSQGGELVLIPEEGLAPSSSASTAPTVGVVAIEMTDGEQSTIYYGRVPE